MQSTTQRRLRFEQLIEAAEQEIQANPRLYNIKVAALAVLGYVVIFGALSLLLALVAGIGWAAFANTAILLVLVKTKLIFALLVMIYVLLRALWVKFGQPVGYRLKPKQHPLLFAELRRLSRKLKAPKVHQVILTPEYNAALLQSPRLGVLGWHKNSLILGLELLLSMSPEQASSVIAHELGHLSGKHSRFSGWIYRVRQSWERIMHGLSQQNNFGAQLLRRFFDWYTPTFAAYSFALARANEYSADAIAAQLTSREAIAHALVNSHVVHNVLNEHYWQPFFKQADDWAEPNGSPYQQLQNYLQKTGFDETALQSHLDKALQVKTAHFDTHPALKDRLAALQCAASAPVPAPVSAAEQWLSASLPTIIAHFDQQWLERNASAWQERHQYVQQGRAKLAELNQQPPEQLDADGLWQKAVLTEEFAPDQDYFALFKQYKDRNPDDANADFVLARLLLAANDIAGVELMQQVMEKRQSLKLSACEWLVYFYRNQNDGQQAAYWQQQAELQYDINQAAQRERDVVTAKDELLMPDQAAAAFQRIHSQVESIKGIKRAWLAEKRMQHYPESKTYVLAFEKDLYNSENAMVKRIVAELEIDGVCFVVMKGGGNKVIAKQVIAKGIRLF
ncbi:hypothetical protein JCM14076_22700 [Methylosoma difficile]